MQNCHLAYRTHFINRLTVAAAVWGALKLFSSTGSWPLGSFHWEENGWRACCSVTLLADPSDQAHVHKRVDDAGGRPGLVSALPVALDGVRAV